MVWVNCDIIHWHETSGHLGMMSLILMYCVHEEDWWKWFITSWQPGISLGDHSVLWDYHHKQANFYISVSCPFPSTWVTLWWFNIAIEMAIDSRFSHWTWRFSLAMLNSQRVQFRMLGSSIGSFAICQVRRGGPSWALCHVRTLLRSSAENCLSTRPKVGFRGLKKTSKDVLW